MNQITNNNRKDFKNNLAALIGRPDRAKKLQQEGQVNGDFLLAPPANMATSSLAITASTPTNGLADARAVQFASWLIGDGSIHFESYVRDSTKLDCIRNMASSIEGRVAYAVLQKTL